MQRNDRNNFSGVYRLLYLWGITWCENYNGYKKLPIINVFIFMFEISFVIFNINLNVKRMSMEKD